MGDKREWANMADTVYAVFGTDTIKRGGCDSVG